MPGNRIDWPRGVGTASAAAGIALSTLGNFPATQDELYNDATAPAAAGAADGSEQV